jgi:hypothetical protein
MIDIKTLNEFAGTSAETFDQFKEQFQSKFILKENAPKDPEIIQQISGKVLGSEMTNLKRMFKGEGIEFNEDEFKEIRKNEELVALAVNKMKGGFLNQIEDVKKLSGNGFDEKVKEYQDKIGKLEKERGEIKSAWKQTADEFEKYKVDVAQSMRSKEIDFRVTKAKEGLRFRPKLNEAERHGFEAILKSKLKFDLDETTGQLITMNASGERIKSKVKAGDFMQPDEAMQEIINELGLGETNPHGGKSAPSIQPTTQGLFGMRSAQQPQGQQPNQEGKKVLVHPKAMR